jgi:hypothetical protein
MKLRLEREKRKLDARIAQVMGLLFPQGRGKAGDKVVDARQIALLEDLHQRVGDALLVRAVCACACPHQFT